MIARFAGTDELAALVPKSDTDAVRDDLDRIRTEMGQAAYRARFLRDARRARKEIAAVRKALGGLSPFIRSSLEQAARRRLLDSYDPHGQFARGDVRTRHDAVPQGLPLGPPLGSEMLGAIEAALDDVEEEAKPSRGAPGYGAAIRFAAPALVDLYCRHSGAPRPYYDQRKDAARNDAALHFAQCCLAAWRPKTALGPRDILSMLS